MDWEVNEKDIVSEPNRIIERNATGTTIVIKDTSRLHTGRYRFSARNALGERHHDFRVHIMDRPDKPTSPIEFLKIYASKICLSRLH